MRLLRVNLDFQWPLNTEWSGGVNPFKADSVEACGECDTTGYSPKAKRLYEQWYGYTPFDPRENGNLPFPEDHPPVVAFAKHNVERAPDFYGSGEEAVKREVRRLLKMWNFMWMYHLDADDVQALVDEGRLWDFTRVPRTPEQVEVVKAKRAAGGNIWLPESNGYIPTPQEVNDWCIGGLGHDSINSWVCIKAKAKRLGFEATCSACHGEGNIEHWNPEVKKLHEAWKPIPPPEGEGYQIWKDNMPLTNVYQDLDYLCQLAADQLYTFAYNKATPEKWKEMLLADDVHHREGNKVFLN